MTLQDLAVRAKSEDVLLTLPEVAEVTGERLETIKTWVYRRKVIECVRVGPYQRRRVRATVILRMFAPHLLPVHRAA